MRSAHQLLTGFSILLAGTLVYLTDRPADSVYFVERYCSDLSLYGSIEPVFGFFGGNLPGFAHAFSFSMITAGLFGKNRKDYRSICLFWVLVNLLFECGQAFTGIAAGLPGPSAVKSYFANGTFDPLDLVALTAGGLAAYSLLVRSCKKELSV